jgi:opacity protein-like surface antigen
MRSKALFAVLTGALFLGLTAGAAAAKPVTITFHEKNATETFKDVIPCLGEEPAPATITTTENGVFHVTAAGIDDQGTPDPNDDTFIPPYHVTGTFTGTFVAVPDDSSLPTFTGHFTQWFGENANRKNFVTTFTFTVIGTGTDGSSLRFHETAHFSVTPGGATLEFDKPRCF